MKAARKAGARVDEQRGCHALPEPSHGRAKSYSAAVEKLGELAVQYPNPSSVAVATCADRRWHWETEARTDSLQETCIIAT